MTVATETNRASYPCNGVLTDFDFTFEIFDPSTDLTVIIRDSDGNETELTYSDDYSVSKQGATWADGGTVTTVLTYGSGNTIVIIRELDYKQELDLTDAGPFPAENTERGLDKNIMLMQQLFEKIGRQLILDKSSPYSNLLLPDPIAGKILVWKDDLSGLENLTSADGAISDDAYSAAWNGVTNVGPSKNAVYDKIAAMISDAVYGAGWNGVSSVAPSKNAVYDVIEPLIPEEGYWTIAVTLSTSGSYTVDTGSDQGAYTKNGRVCHVQGRVAVTGESSPVGTIRISLPFVAASLNEYADHTAGAALLMNHGGTIANGIYAYVSVGESYFLLSNVADDGTQQYLDKDDVDSEWQLAFDFSYITAA